MKTIESVVQYIDSFPKETQKLLLQMRDIIKKAAPKAEEYIGYGMPAFKQNGPVVYFAGYKNHIGFYPTGTGIANFQKEISKYKSSKGAVQFPLDQPLPSALITKIVKFKLKENEDRLKEKALLKGAAKKTVKPATKKAAKKVVKKTAKKAVKK